MNLKMIFFVLLASLFLFEPAVWSGDLSAGTKTSEQALSPSLNDILKKVENRYAVSGFSAHFSQTSTLKAMKITDRASGEAFFKYPGKMRWEYEAPARQIIITDNHTLWIFRPEDNQVMIGKAPVFFKGGKGFSFLSDLKMIEEKFDITLEEKSENGNYRLKLLPREKTFDVSEIYLWVSKKTFHVVRIVTYNSYGDETQIDFSNIQFEPKLDDAMFSFKVPKGIEILNLDE